MRKARTLAWAALAGLSLAGCASPGGEAGPSPSTETTSQAPAPAGQEAAPEPGTAGEASGGPEPDYSEDAGEDMKEYVYTDIAPPADTTVGTLCNLTQEFLAGIRGPDTDAPGPDLRTTLLGLEDLLSEWTVLRPHYPDRAEHFDAAQEAYEAWDEAVWHAENGESKEAGEAMARGEAALSKLPAEAPDECF